VSAARSDLDRYAKLYVGLGAVFVTCLVVGDVIGGKNTTTPLGAVSVGMYAFPVTFLLTDVVNDFYGVRGARFLTLVGFGAAALSWLILQLATHSPTDDSSYFRAAEFTKIFGGSAQLFVASMLAYLVGQFLDIHVFQFWKALTRSRHLWLRATGSTLLSQLVDTATINLVFWWSKQPLPWIGAKIIREYGLKVVVAFALTPAVYALHALLVRRLGLEPAPPERVTRR
jgi:queuosine precursor transporter